MVAVEVADESDACYPGDAELTCIIYAIYVFNIRGSFVGSTNLTSKACAIFS